MTEPTFAGRVVVVTGAGRGIGAATATLFARHGARVALLGRTMDELDAVANAITTAHGAERALAVGCDVSLENEVRHAFSQVDRAWERCDVLVNNAGVLHVAPVWEMTLEAWEHVQAVNVRGAFLCAREAFVRMRAQGTGGAIVNVSSLGGIRSTEKFAGYSAYAASKSALVGMTEAWATEGRANGIRVNAIAPGAVDTELFRQGSSGLRTHTTPDDIAPVIVFLADPTAAKTATGAVLELNTNG